MLPQADLRERFAIPVPGQAHLALPDVQVLVSVLPHVLVAAGAHDFDAFVASPSAQQDGFTGIMQYFQDATYAGGESSQADQT